MATKKQTGTEYRFKIDAFTPETIPMARLAQYMAEVATILGEQSYVHFQGLEAGSTILVQRIEREALPKVRDRANAVRRQDAPSDALKAYRQINKYLKEDNAIASLQEKKATILPFPGRDQVDETYPAIKQQGTLDGKIVSVAGADNTVHVRLLSEGASVSGCYTTNRTLAKELANRWDEPVRLTGVGSWSRDNDGKWSLEKFRIDSFEVLRETTLADALAELRDLPFAFQSGAYDELSMVRHGPGRSNGSH